MADEMRKRSSQDTGKLFLLTDDMLIEILSPFEAKYLLRFKCVCKAGYSIIRNKCLVDMHAIRTENLISGWGRDNFTPIGRYCRGLVLERSIQLAPDMLPAIYRIRNPTTKRLLNLPHPHGGVIHMQIFLNPSTSAYYVVSIFFHKAEKKYNLELLDLGGHSNDLCHNANLSWRILKISVFDMLSRQQRYHFSYCMSSEGILYILTLPKVGLNNPIIMCVDLVKQTCKILHVPRNLYFNWKELIFQSWIDKPSVVFVREEKLHILVLEDYEKQKWAGTIIIPLPFLKRYPTLTKMVPYIHRDDGDEEDVLIYHFSRVTCYVYKLGSESPSNVPTPGMRVPATLVSLKGMQPEKEEG